MFVEGVGRIFLKIYNFGVLGVASICVDSIWVGVFHALDHQTRIVMV